MTRRHWIHAASGALAAPAAQNAQTTRPNVLLILADDLGYGDLGCYGQKQIATPNLDALATEGTRFTSTYAGSTVCAPSRCCLMTGYHTGHARVRGNGKNETALGQTDVVLPELLRQAGYATGLFGKWGLGKMGYPGYPTKKGFDEWFGFFTQLQAHNYYPELLQHNDTVVELTGNTGTSRKDYAPDVIHSRAMEWLGKQKAERPFFLVYNSIIPHANNEMGRDTGNGLQVPSDAPYMGRPWAAVERNYAAMVGLLDRQVAQLVDRLKRQGLYDNTLILFSSDNGPHREGGHDPDFFHSSGPLRGIKRDLTEGGIRVPAIAVWPGKIPAGKTSDDPWAFWDVLPTICDVAGVKSPAGIDGASQWEAWQGKGSRAHGPFYWEFHERGFTQAVRDGQWKAIRNGKGKIELYDLVADLGEQNDLAERHPEMVRRMDELMRSMRTPDPDYPTPGL